MKLAIGADHRGFEYKEYIQAHKFVTPSAISWLDVGTFTADRTDYPLYATQVAELVAAGTVDRGILICGSGIGMVIAANRYKGVYAAIAWNETVAHFAAEHDKVNVLSIPSDFVTEHMAVAMIQEWLSTSFLGGRYQQRIDLIDKI